MVINAALNSAERNATTIEGFCLASVLDGVYVAGTVIYALAIYPRCFSLFPAIQNARAISFLNGFFGGIVFGSLWNTCLTKHKLGISHIVAGVVSILGFLLIVYNLYGVMS